MNIVKNNLFSERLKDTYIWNVFSNALNFISLIYASSMMAVNPQVFGVFSLVFSIYFLIGYFDLGFTSSSLKFYSESLKSGKYKRYNILGFIFFIFIVLGALFACLFFLISDAIYFTDNLSDLASETFKTLCLISAFFCFSIAFKKVGDIHFSATVQTYIQHKAIAFGSLCKLIAALIFFHFYDYQIARFFFAFLAIDFVINVYLFFKVINFRDIWKFIFKHIRFHKGIFTEQKSLAFTTIMGALIAIICFESDIILGEVVIKSKEIFLISAVYFLTTPLKRFISILFVPLFPRFNHFYGEKNHTAINNLFKSLMKLLILISPYFAILFIVSFDLILLIYGEEYIGSIDLLRISILTYFLIFLTNPIISILRTYLKIKELMLINIIQLSVFFVVLFTTFTSLGIYSIFISKFLSTFVIVVLMVIQLRFLINKLYQLIALNILSFLSALLIFYFFELIILQSIFDNIFLLERYVAISLTFFVSLLFLYFRRRLGREFLKSYNLEK